MHASEIRRRFLDYFARQGHVIRPSSALVPADDPTLLFTNAGMVQFKKIFLGQEAPPDGQRRATTSQKCVRAGGKHNDLEQVGHTARHHTFFEMLGNFSFGDYFKREAIRFAWEFVTEELKLPKEHLRVTVYHEDDEARELWQAVAGVPPTRIYGLGERDNFWQMADTGPCGPCSEIYVDLAHLTQDFAFPKDATGEWTRTDLADVSLDAFVEGAEAGRFLEIWNLVFMQYDRQADGTLVPLPKPSVDTGAGLERIAAVLQGVSNNYHTDLFTPLLDRVAEVTGAPYAFHREDSVSYRVLADHARAVTFLLADGVFPSNEGRGYVLRRILRRGVRHAWLLGRREPTLVHVVERVIELMGAQFPEVGSRRSHILDTTRAEEERFLATVDGGMSRFEQLAPLGSTQGSTAIRGTISGEDVFKLYDTFGFPVDLTELMARERGYVVDLAGFEAALDAQRRQSQEERKSRQLGVAIDDLADPSQWRTGPEALRGRFVGYDRSEVDTEVVAMRTMDDGRIALILAESPFYAESGGQVADQGEVVGEGWRLEVADVRKVDGQVAVIGQPTGTVRFARARARVPADRRRDTERNHTATHLLHAALRTELGDHVHQAGSLVAPDRLRFDFTHHGPVTREQLDRIEQLVNEGIWANADVRISERSYQEAIAAGAMALFGEKYGDVVRVVDIPGLSTELCGGTHVRNTGQIGVLRIVGESGVAAGVRRIEAVTGRRAHALLREREATLVAVATKLKVNALTTEVLTKKVDDLLAERKKLERRVEEALAGGGAGGVDLLAGAESIGAARLLLKEVTVPTMKELQGLGDAVRAALGSGIGLLLGTFEDEKQGLVVVVTDDQQGRGITAGTLVKALSAATGIKGGGKPHMAQAGVAADQREAVRTAAHRLATTALEGGA
ncbi:MAG: alanyl-tRNA synthetase [Gemmatimonadota bacterium]